MVKAEKGTQVSVSVQNERGILSKITALLGAERINIYALTLTGGIDHGYIRIVADDADKAVRALTADGHLVFKRDVVLLQIANEPGALSRVSGLWAEQGVNLEYAYCTGGPNVTEGLVVLRVDDVDKALEVLNADNMES